ncbi:MAG: hypothetical protein ACLRSW_01700 [Christensenellaceae bacterium]
MFTIVVRLNQIEVAPGAYLGDESTENTPENLKKFREAIAKAIPEARITIAFSHSALADASGNYRNCAGWQGICAKVRRRYHLCGRRVFIGAYVPGKGERISTTLWPCLKR